MAACFAGLMQAQPVSAGTAAVSAGSYIINTSSNEVKDLLEASGLAGINSALYSAQDALNVGDEQDLARQASSLQGYRTFRKSVANLKTATGTTVGAEIARRLDEAEASNSDTSDVEAYVRSLQLTDGPRLIEVVAPGLIYTQLTQTSTTPLQNVTDEAEPQLCALSGCEEPLPSPPATCNSSWIYFAVRKLQFTDYLFYANIYGETVAKRKCSTSTLVTNAIVDRIHVTLISYEYGYFEGDPDDPNDNFWDCWPQETREATAYNTYIATRSWNSFYAFEGATSRHEVDFDNWHHRSELEVWHESLAEEHCGFYVP